MRLLTDLTFALDATDRPIATRLTGGAVCIHDSGGDVTYSIRFRPCAAHIKVLSDCLRLLQESRADKMEETNDGE